MAVKKERSESELRMLADSIPQLAWMAEPDGNIFWYNRRWFEYTGTTMEQMQGWGWQAVHDPEMLPLVTERWKQSLQTGEAFEMEFPLRGADGELRWFLTRVNPMRDEQGRVTRWFGTNTDVDEVKRIREALREETATLEQLNQIGSSIAFILDLDELVQKVTDAATQLSGAAFGAFFYTRKDESGGEFLLYALSGAPREAFGGFPNPRSTAIFGPTFQGEGPVRYADVTQAPEYGKNPPYHGMPPGHLPVRSYLAVPVTSRSGEAIGGIFLGHSAPGVFTERHERLLVGLSNQAAVAMDNARLYADVKQAALHRERILETERAARAEAERVSLLKDEFLATLSHELRTPLNAILGWSQLIRSSRIDEADLQKGLDVIERNARVQAQLIEDLLDMSSILSGKLRLEAQATDLASVVRSAVEAVRPSADAKGVRLESILDSGAGSVLGDANRLQQVFWNLLSNAIKFTPRSGRVQIVLRRVNSSVEVSVADNGVGIAPEFLPLVFERFRQADSSTTRAYGGLGLGLSIVKHLVEMHGGLVKAESGGLGQGSTFTVHLPVSLLSAPCEDSQPVPADLSIDLSGVKILVVDDEADARDLVQRLLEERGATVFAAGDAAEALEIVQREQPDVLLSDIGMPHVDGYELLRQIRTLGPQHRRLKAIALTAFVRAEDRMKSLRAGFLVHASKPILPAELLATVASVTGRLPD